MRKLLPLLLLLFLVAGCALSGARDLAHTERVEIEPGGSCGLRFIDIEYRGDVYSFEWSDEDDMYPPKAWEMFDPVPLVVGTFKGEVWAVGPDDSLWRLVRHEEAALWFCLW